MRFYKSKPFLFSLAVAIVLVLVPIVMAIMGVTAPLKNAAATIAVPFQWCAHQVTSAAQGFVAYFTEFDELKQENAALREQLAIAQDRLHRAALLEDENAYLRSYLALPDMESQLSLVDAQIIARASGNATTVYTLNRGSLQGITPGMPVITSDGLVGCISEVGLNWSRVTSLLELGASAGAYVERSGALGLAEGTYELREMSLCRLAYLEENADVAEGDRIVTSGYGSIYPQGLVIGTVREVQSDTYNRQKVAILEPAVDFDRLIRVMIITDCLITPVDPAATPTDPDNHTQEGGAHE